MCTSPFGNIPSVFELLETVCYALLQPQMLDMEPVPVGDRFATH